jgi:8-oxo-dGTP diphosphatase
MKPADIVVMIIHRDGKILAEKRRADDDNEPGKIEIPRGHVEPGETHDQACARELREELYLTSRGFRFLVKMPYHTPVEDQLLHYYVCENWRGKPRNLEAGHIFWIPRDQISLLDITPDREAMKLFNKMIIK